MSTFTTVRNTTSTTSARRFPRWAKFAAALIAVLLVAAAAMFVRMSYVPNDLNTSTTVLSENQLFSASYEPQVEAIAINQIHTWQLHVETPDGEPVEDAVIAVDGGMPQHGHGLPTAPQVTEYLGNGDYLVEGMKFNMGGWWVLTFDIATNGQTDTVTFNMVLE